MVGTYLVGRDHEIQRLDELLRHAEAGKGTAVVLGGAAGMGKSMLAEKFKEMAEAREFDVLWGSADAHTLRPFHILSKLLNDIGLEPLLQDTEFTGFTKAFAINKAGLLVAEASPGEDELDSDIFAGMLSAVQDFVRDSFDAAGDGTGSLGRLEYGNLKIIIEHSQYVFLTAVISGEEHPNMKSVLRLAVQDIQESMGDTLSKWKGNMEEMAPVKGVLEELVRNRFLVRRNLDGVKLEAERLRVADSMLDSLKILAAKVPLAIVLEDIHWADESSLFVLEYLARNIPGMKIVVLATVRLEEMESVKGLFDKMKEENTCQFLDIGGLDPSNARDLVELELGKHSLEDEFMEKLVGRCEGNPFFLREMLHHMVQDGLISLVDGQHILVNDTYSIPGSVEEVIQRRLDNLDPDAVAIAEFISCIGRNFDAAVPNATCLINEPMKALRKLEESGIIVNSQFTHALFQEVIYSGISDRWLSAYHENIGEIYENLYRTDDVVFELARHFSRSRDAQKGFEYCFRAGEKAELGLAPEQAAEYYELALKCLSNTRIDSEQQEMDLLLRLSDVYSLIGESDKSLEKLDRAMALEKDMKAMAAIHRKRAMVFERKADYVHSGEECEKGLELLGDQTTSETIQLLIAYAAVALRTGGPEKAIERSLRALALAREWGEEKLIGNALHLLGSIYLVKGDFGNAINILTEAVEVRERLGNEVGLAGTLNNLGVSLYYSGKVNEALNYFERCLESYIKTGDKYGMAAALNNLGGFTQDLGELDKALDYHLKSIKIKESIGDRYGVASSLTNLGIVYRRLGDYEKALEYNNRGLKLATEIDNAKERIININNLAEAYLEMGQLDSAMEKYIEGLEASREAGDLHQECHAVRGMAKVHTEKGQGLQAVENARRALEISINTSNTGEEWRSRYVLGAALRISGSYQLAGEEFIKSSEIAKASGTGEIDPAVLYEEALLFRDTGRKEAARKNLEIAAASFGKKGYAPVVKKIEAELERL